MNQKAIELRSAETTDLAAINRLIDEAVMQWDLPERVKRLSLPAYHYDVVDLQHEDIQLALKQGVIVGVVAWEREPQAVMLNKTGLLLHGLYVSPGSWRQGIGRCLFQQAVKAVKMAGLDGLLVKSQKDAEPFYRAQGMVRLPVRDSARDFEQRYWLAVK